MFGLTLNLPEHVRVTIDPHPEDAKSFLLVIQASMDKGKEPLSIQKKIPRTIGAIDFGKDLMAGVNHLHAKLTGR